MEPVFSVITVHFNQLPWLKSTVNNVLAQKGFGELIEYIIVDGLSNDGTLDYLHSLQFQNSIQHEENNISKDFKERILIIKTV